MTQYACWLHTSSRDIHYGIIHVNARFTVIGEMWDVVIFIDEVCMVVTSTWMHPRVVRLTNQIGLTIALNGSQICVIDQ